MSRSQYSVPCKVTAASGKRCISSIVNLWLLIVPRTALPLQYIIDHPDTVPFSSVSELAESGDVSVATVSRLPKKLGVKNLRDLKIAIAQESGPTHVDAIYEGVKPEDSDEDIVNKVFGTPSVCSTSQISSVVP